jgi:hypothetical protein
MFESALTLIAATDRDTLIEPAAVHPRCPRSGRGQDSDAPSRTLCRREARSYFIVQELANRRNRRVAARWSPPIENEMLDELADFIGVRSKVAEITRQAMNGEIDFATALKTRAALFKDLPETAPYGSASRPASQSSPLRHRRAALASRSLPGGSASLLAMSGTCSIAIS